MKVDGIILRKTPYKEKDLICEMLLRSGELLSLYFYGGRGSSKKKSSSLLEVGYFLSVVVNDRVVNEETMKTAKEWTLKWESSQIRLNHKAFYLMSFFCEMILKIATPYDARNENMRNEHQGLFNVLSNALFNLDAAIAQKLFHSERHLFFFITKLIHHTGITPDLEHCLFCECELQGTHAAYFNIQDGGFSCHDCANQRENESVSLELQFGYSLLMKMENCLKSKYDNVENIDVSHDDSKRLLSFISYQFGFHPTDFKTYQMIF
jgi:DNA repair protein RecO